MGMIRPDGGVGDHGGGSWSLGRSVMSTSPAQSIVLIEQQLLQVHCTACTILSPGMHAVHTVGYCLQSHDSKLQQVLPSVINRHKIHISQLFTHPMTPCLQYVLFTRIIYINIQLIVAFF